MAGNDDVLLRVTLEGDGGGDGDSSGGSSSPADQSRDLTQATDSLRDIAASSSRQVDLLADILAALRAPVLAPAPVLSDPVTAREVGQAVGGAAGEAAAVEVAKTLEQMRASVEDDIKATQTALIDELFAKSRARRAGKSSEEAPIDGELVPTDPTQLGEEASSLIPTAIATFFGHVSADVIEDIFRGMRSVVETVVQTFTDLQEVTATYSAVVAGEQALRERDLVLAQRDTAVRLQEEFQPIVSEQGRLERAVLGMKTALVEQLLPLLLPFLQLATTFIELATFFINQVLPLILETFRLRFIADTVAAFYKWAREREEKKQPSIEAEIDRFLDEEI